MQQVNWGIIGYCDVQGFQPAIGNSESAMRTNWIVDIILGKP
jgi:hypothetical protein